MEGYTSIPSLFQVKPDFFAPRVSNRDIHDTDQ